MTERIQGFVGIAINGNPIDAGVGVSGPGTIRVIEASDSPLASLDLHVEDLNPNLETLNPLLNTLNPLLSDLVPVLEEIALPATTFTRIATGVTEDKVVISATPAALKSLGISNINASPCYVKLYDLAVEPTVASDVPVQTYLCPGGTAGGVRDVKLPTEGLNFAVGIAMVIVTGVAATNGTEVTADQVVVNGSFK